MELKDAIKGRRSIRSFQATPIDNDVIKDLIATATYAPSASNKQAWKFIVIDDIAIREKISMMNGGVVQNGGSSLILQAPQGILVLYRKDTSRNYRLYKDHIQSASACIENLLLAAHEKGIGTCWMCKLPYPAYIRKLLNIPKYYDVISYIAIGYPKSYLSEHTLFHYEGDPAKSLKRERKYSPDDVVCFNKFENHSNTQGVLKHPFIASCLHILQLHIKNDNCHPLIKKIIIFLFRLIGIDVTRKIV